MGSVYVNWEGTCRERAVQEELVGFLRELAECSQTRCRGPAPARSAFLTLMMGPREQNAPRIEPIRMFDQEITGRIVLDPKLARDGQALHDEVQRLKPEMIAINTGGTDKAEAFSLRLDSSEAQWCLGLQRLRVYGIDFQLFDPRGLYPGADRMSFVFLESADLPSLNGCLAQVENREQCQSYQNEVIRAADWYVSAPTIHLRYYLEEWSDFLLSWVKYFFVPDLYYRRYEEMSGHESLRAAIENECREYGENDTKRVLLIGLQMQFEKEADEYAQRMSDEA